MLLEYIAQIYAKSLYNVCGDKLEGEVKQFLEVDCSFFTDVKLRKEIKLAIIKQLGLSDELLNLCKVLLHNQRFKSLNSVLLNYIKFIKQNRGEIDVKITSCILLNKKNQDEIIEMLKSRKKEIQKVNIQNIIDKKILGGFTIKVGSEIIDLSILAKLNKLREMSLNALSLIK